MVRHLALSFGRLPRLAVIAYPFLHFIFYDNLSSTFTPPDCRLPVAFTGRAGLKAHCVCTRSFRVQSSRIPGLFNPGRLRETRPPD